MAKASATVTKLRRIKKKDPDPNPLFTKWLQEWKETAVASNSKLQHVYGKALKSLKKYPLVLKSGKEAKILEYFGDKLCNMLDKKLEEHWRENPDWCPPSDSAAPTVLDSTDEDDSPASASQYDATTSSSGGQAPAGKVKRKKADDAGPTAKKRGPRKYIPLPRSGAHAILVVLGQRRLQLKATWAGASSHDWMSKSDLIVAAQPLCDASFTQPLPDTHYTAWSSMATLIKKGLVTKQGCPARFSLTDEGEELACRLISPGTPPGSAASHVLNGDGIFTSSLSDEDASNGFPVVTLPPPPPLDSLRIVLLVDCSETTAVSQERFLRELRALDILHEVRRLNVGDFVWVCRSEGGIHGRREWVLGPLVERKRTDDLAKSIVDGRFHEQKVRLGASGIKPVVYLIEETGGKSTSCISDAALEQGILNTQVSNGFLIKWTRDPRDTACFLGITTCHLQTKKAAATSSAEFLEGKPTWEDFNAGGVKSRGLQVREMLALNLLQVKGLSLDKVMPLVERYPTPIRLFEAFERAASDPRGRSAFLKDCGIPGKALHDKLWTLYGSSEPLQ
ncbi:crossover junction endonuclease MUS81-like [Rhipicephalus sanguineus]|uniref:crossover junction endonuclease MUS81-like n=1 Tax=Rhipicephalus sanguineus TaxID=34632 RepID=UPI001894D1FC|nr:crossover junction endonuclease MUS81-like [Rhipicephalus sanguineus]